MYIKKKTYENFSNANHDITRNLYNLYNNTNIEMHCNIEVCIKQCHYIKLQAKF